MDRVDLDLLKKASKFLIKFYVLFYIFPIFAVLTFVAKFGVDVPFFDSFALVDLFYKIHLGDASLADFWQPHNEHRIFFPRFIASSLAFLTNWNAKVEQYFSVLLATISFGILCWIPSQGKWSKSSHLSAITTGIVLFSLIQYENWLWGFQIAWFWINTCLVLAIALLVHPSEEKTPIDRGFVLAALCCGLASFSSAHGLLVWLAVFPSVWVKSQNFRYPRLQKIVWFGLFFGSTLLYASDYRESTSVADRAYILKHPLEGFKFFFALIGRSISQEVSEAIVWGIIVSIACVGCLWLLYRDRERRASISPWVSLMLFPLAFAAITTIGRASLGVGAGLASRYTTVSLLSIVALIQVGQCYAKSCNPMFRFSYRSIVSLLAVFMIVTSLSSWEKGRAFRDYRLIGQTCLSLSEYMENSESSCLRRIFPDVYIIKQWSKKLDRLGFFGFVKDAKFAENPQTSCGSIDISNSPRTARLSDEERITLSGNVRLDACAGVLPIVFVSENARNEMLTGNAIQDFGRQQRSQEAWTIDIVARDLEIGETAIRAWVYNPERSTFIPLDNIFEVRVAEEEKN